MTEDEARVTQCCGPPGCGYFNDAPRPARWCVGPDCMAWREIKKFVAPHEDWGSPNTLGAPSDRSVLKVEGGYCGLAGRPE